MNRIERIFEILSENERVMGYGGCENCEIEWNKEDMRKELNEELEDLRIEIVKAVDNVFAKENVITIRLKQETLANEVLEIAEKINDFLEKTTKEKVLEVLC
jgi:hypothetical protein